MASKLNVVLKLKEEIPAEKLAELEEWIFKKLKAKVMKTIAVKGKVTWKMVAKDAAMVNDENLRLIFKKEKVNLIVRDIEIAEG
jgi:hypothetical protein